MSKGQNPVACTRNIDYVAKDRRDRKILPLLLERYVHNHSNATHKEIALFFKCSKNAIGKALKRYKISHKTNHARKLSPEQLKIYIQEHPEATQKDIAKYFACHFTTVNHSIKANKIKYHNKRPVNNGHNSAL